MREAITSDSHIRLAAGLLEIRPLGAGRMLSVPLASLGALVLREPGTWLPGTLTLVAEPGDGGPGWRRELAFQPAHVDALRDLVEEIGRDCPGRVSWTGTGRWHRRDRAMVLATTRPAAAMLLLGCGALLVSAALTSELGISFGLLLSAPAVVPVLACDVITCHAQVIVALAAVMALPAAGWLADVENRRTWVALPAALFATASVVAHANPSSTGLHWFAAGVAAVAAGIFLVGALATAVALPAGSAAGLVGAAVLAGMTLGAPLDAWLRVHAAGVSLDDLAILAAAGCVVLHRLLPQVSVDHAPMLDLRALLDLPAAVIGSLLLGSAAAGVYLLVVGQLSGHPFGFGPPDAVVQVAAITIAVVTLCLLAMLLAWEALSRRGWLFGDRGSRRLLPTVLALALPSFAVTAIVPWAETALVEAGMGAIPAGLALFAAFLTPPAAWWLAAASGGPSARVEAPVAILGLIGVGGLGLALTGAGRPLGPLLGMAGGVLVALAMGLASGALWSRALAGRPVERAGGVAAVGAVSLLAGATFGQVAGIDAWLSLHAAVPRASLGFGLRPPSMQLPLAAMTLAIVAVALVLWRGRSGLCPAR